MLPHCPIFWSTAGDTARQKSLVIQGRESSSNLSELIYFGSNLKSSANFMLSDDFRGNKSRLICLNLLNISDSAMIRNQTEYDIFGMLGVTLLFEHSPSRSSEIEHFEIFSRPRENQLAWHFFVKFNLLLFFLIP